MARSLSTGAAASLSRRRFLSATALAGAAASAGGIAWTRPARALSFAPMPAQAQALYKAACSATADPYHAQLVATVVAAAEGRHATQADIDRELAAMRCPLCGCSLAQNLAPLPETATPASKG